MRVLHETRPMAATETYLLQPTRGEPNRGPERSGEGSRRRGAPSGPGCRGQSERRPEACKSMKRRGYAAASEPRFRQELGEGSASGESDERGRGESGASSHDTPPVNADELRHRALRAHASFASSLLAADPQTSRTGAGSGLRTSRSVHRAVNDLIILRIYTQFATFLPAGCVV